MCDCGDLAGSKSDVETGRWRLRKELQLKTKGSLLVLQEDQCPDCLSQPGLLSLNAIGTSLVVLWLRIHLPFQRGVGLIPGQGGKIPHASRPKKQNIKQKQYCNRVNKDFKNCPH